jgi:hypothetical protein
LFEEFPHLKKRERGATHLGAGYFCATVGQITEEMIKNYLEHHFEPNPNDDFKTEPQQDASFRRRVSGLPVRNPNPPASAGGCLVKVDIIKAIFN